ncbi:MAG: PQQ-binding-like beta-propeller repeat protein [Halobacteriaceae archaeon]
MQPGRRRVLQGLGAAGTGVLAGCIGPIDSLLDDGSDPHPYTRWLPPPGAIVPATRYRFRSVRPRQLTDPNRAQRILPTLPGTGVAARTVDRVVAVTGAFAVTGSFQQSTVVASLREAGYDYVDGVGPAWLMAPTDGTPPVYAVDDGALVAGYPVEELSARRVATTVMGARDTDPHWTTTAEDVPALTGVLGDPPVLTAGFHDQVTGTAPVRAVFDGSVGWGIAEHGPGRGGATIAVLFAAADQTSVQAVRSWAATVFGAATVDASDRVVTVETDRPPTPWTRLPVPDRSWPMHGADPANTAAVPDTRPPGDPIDVAWTTGVEVSGSATTPVVAEDTIVLGAGDLFALAAEDGTQRWRFDTNVYGPSAVVDDSVVVPTVTGMLAVALEDGTERWHTPLPNRWPVTAATPVGDRLVCGSWEAGILVMDPGTGAVESTVLEAAVRYVPGIADEMVYAVDRTDSLHAVTVDGDRRWTHPFEAPIRAAPVVDADHVYVVTPNTLHAIDRTTGGTAWTADFDTWVPAGPAVTEDLVIVGEGRPGTSTPGSLTGLTVEDGDRHWTRPLSEAAVGRPAVAGDHIHIAGAAGSISAHALTDGAEQYSRFLGGRLRPPVVVDDQLVVASLGGRVTSLEEHWLPGSSGD